MIRAVVFDMDGVLIDSEQIWNDVKRDVVEAWGGTWHTEAGVAMMGMSSPEWSVYMADELQVGRSADEVNAEVLRRMHERYRLELPLLPGAVEAVKRLAARFELGLASSSNRSLIDEVLATVGLDELFSITVSSEEVERGKPSPDVYLEAARRLGVDPAALAAIEDSAAGIRAAAAAGMRVLALPNPHYPPDPAALRIADVVLGSLDELSPELIDPS